MGLFSSVFKQGPPKVSKKIHLADPIEADRITDWFLNNDELVNVVSGDSIEMIFREGIRPPLVTGFNPESKSHAYSALDWFGDKLRGDLELFSAMKPTEMKKMIDKFATSFGNHLQEYVRLGEKNGIDTSRFRGVDMYEKIQDEKERRLFMEHLISDTMLSAEARILGWVYFQVTGKDYSPPS